MNKLILILLLCLPVMAKAANPPPSTKPPPTIVDYAPKPIFRTWGDFINWLRFRR